MAAGSFHAHPFLASATLALATLAGAAPLPAGAQPRAGVATQLPRGAVPLHYAVDIEPDAGHLTFSARTRIDIRLDAPTRAITLNAAGLTIRSVTLTPAGGGSPVVARATLDEKAQTLTVLLPQMVTAGLYALGFDYSGLISTQANGLFALDYSDGQGAPKRALFTQFEAPDARRVLPSWDEPSYKASFDLSLVVPGGQMAVGNMPVARSEARADGSRLVHFATTPKMSTYLLFFGMGELERVTKMAGATEVGVVTGKGNSARAQTALDAAAEILPFYNAYFDTPYPLPKLDNVAGPGQSQFFSAMENWGAIFTFERAMLVDPASTTEATRRRVFEVAAHEMAHQWFGDLVTMAWWDDLWLNEGFASWMATKATTVLRPEWQAQLNRVEGRESAMGLDAFVTTHPVVQKIGTVEEVNQAFDTITYEKGEAVIAMLEDFAGENVWRAGIRAYLRAHAYGNTRTSDLWNAVEAAGATGLSTVANEFTRQPGIPLVEVKGAACEGGNTRLSLSQSRFSRDRRGPADLKWHVPVRAGVPGRGEAKLLLYGTGSLILPGCGAYLINIGQAGYYRTLYPAANIAALASQFVRLAPIDQTGLIADNWQLGQGGYQPITHALDLIDAVPVDASDGVLLALPGYMRAVHDSLAGHAGEQAAVLAYAHRKLAPMLARVGFDPQPGEGPQVPLLRQNLIAALGDMGEEKVVAEARRRFAALDGDPAALDGQLKYVWLSIVARYADAATWDHLREMAHGAPTALDKARSFALLGLPRDEALGARALDLALTDEPGKTTGAAIIAAVSGDHAMQALNFVLANKAHYDELVDSSARSQALARLGGGSADPPVADRLAAYADAEMTAESRKVVDRAISAIRARADSNARLRPQFNSWFATHR